MASPRPPRHNEALERAEEREGGWVTVGGGGGRVPGGEGGGRGGGVEAEG